MKTTSTLSEETIKRLQIPVKGNSITYFAGATIQGAKAPRGFGVARDGVWQSFFRYQLPSSWTRAPFHDRLMARLVST
jgi:hypothetical protein